MEVRVAHVTVLRKQPDAGMLLIAALLPTCVVPARPPMMSCCLTVRIWMAGQRCCRKSGVKLNDIWSVADGGILVARETDDNIRATIRTTATI